VSFINNKTNAWITGHKGFLGKELVKNLKKEFEIFKISRNDIIESNKYFAKKIPIDSIKKNDLRKFNNNFLFHLATLYNPNPKSREEINQIIESNLLFGLRLFQHFGYDFFSKILLTQSYAELHKNLSKNIYSQTKSLFAREIEKKISEKVVKVYIYDTFGLFDKRNKLINIWLKQLILNQTVTIFSEKTKINLSSKEFVTKIISSINFVDPGKYEIRSEVDLTLIELFYLLKDITNSKSRFILKKNTPINVSKKYKSLSQVVDIHYTLKDFKKDIVKILKKEMKI
jgi:nucleoside-diphosphate-sugar epimerase